MADQLDMGSNFVINVGQEVGRQLPEQMRCAVVRMRGTLKPADSVIVDRLVQFVEKTTRQTLRRLAG